MRNACLVALALVLPAVAYAQTPSTTAASSSSAPKGFAAVHLGGQASGASLSDTFTFSVYDETASVATEQDYGSGFLFNVEAGYAFMPRLAAGFAISRVTSDASSRVAASIPHPERFDSPRAATFDVPDTDHKETGYHFFVAYLFPVREGLDLRVFAGPSVIQMSHDLVSAVQFTETAPFTSVTINGASLDTRKKTVGAFHVGVGGTYALTDRLGVDGFFRFARRTVDVPAIASGDAEIKVGGAQFGVGIRVGF